MAKKRVKGLLTIRVSLVPGVCRWCQCTENRPCDGGCRWANRAQTLCSACRLFDMAMGGARGRKGIAHLLQVVIENAADL